jgi:hypothetical protein
VSTATGPAAGVVVHQQDGLGVVTKPPRDPLGIWRRRRKRHAESGRQWFSPISYYLGPFDDATGLEGSTQFFRRTNLYRKPPQVYVTTTETGLGIVPITNWIMTKGRGAAETLWLPYPTIDSIELRPATKERMSVMLPNTAWQLGQIIITTNANRTARLSGTTVRGLSAFLKSLGATVET